MKHARLAALVPSALLAVAAVATAPPADAAAPDGAVYVLSNQAAGNAVVAYDRAADGTLSYDATYPTGGLGSGTGLGSQNSIVVDDSGRHVYAVNAGSDSVTAFDVTASGLAWTATVPSGGDQPVSVSVRGSLVYVLNAGADGNVSAFRATHGGALAPIAGSTRPLSASVTGAAQVQISPDGKSLVVTEKATSLLDVYRLLGNGLVASQDTVASEGSTPFGFDFTPAGDLAVSEAGPSATSTYDVHHGRIATLDASVGNNQAAACWVVVTDDGTFAYTGNGGGSQSISGYRVGAHAQLSLLDADGRTGTAAAGVSDIALSAGSEFLYARLGDGTIGAYGVGEDGSLSALPVAGGLPAGAQGIAAR